MLTSVIRALVKDVLQGDSHFQYKLYYIVPIIKVLYSLFIVEKIV